MTMPSITQLGIGASLIITILLLAHLYKNEVQENVELQQQSATRLVEKAGNAAGEKIYDEKTAEQNKRAQAVQDAWTTAHPEHDDLVDPELLRVLEASGVYKSSGGPEVPGNCGTAGAPDRCGKDK